MKQEQEICTLLILFSPARFIASQAWSPRARLRSISRARNIYIHRQIKPVIRFPHQRSEQHSSICNELNKWWLYTLMSTPTYQGPRSESRRPRSYSPHPSGMTQNWLSKPISNPKRNYPAPKEQAILDKSVGVNVGWIEKIEEKRLNYSGLQNSVKESRGANF